MDQKLVQKERSFYYETTLEEKLKYVRFHLDEGVPIFEIQEKYGLDRSTLKYYCALYRKWGKRRSPSDIKNGKIDKSIAEITDFI